MRKWLKRGALSLLSIILFAAVGVYAGAQMRLKRSYDVPLATFSVPVVLPDDEAKRRALTFMCSGCHREAGGVIFEAPGVGRLVAPNLGRVARAYSDDELARLVRHGVKRDGTGVIAMPSSTFAHIADEDIGAIIQWLRALPERPDAQPAHTEWGPLGLVALVAGEVPFEADRIPAITPPARRPAALGRYLYETTCSHCHDLDTERPVEGAVAPALHIVAPAYAPEDFARLMRTGKALGDRELKLMSNIARSDFSHFTDAEIEAIQTYLTVEKRAGD
jgi:mono/diheme cytochrome c family protein